MDTPSAEPFIDQHHDNKIFIILTYLDGSGLSSSLISILRKKNHNKFQRLSKTDPDLDKV